MKSPSDVTASVCEITKGVAIQSATINRAGSTPDASGLGPWERRSMAARQKAGQPHVLPRIRNNKEEIKSVASFVYVRRRDGQFQDN
jgi:hypothetical protein